MIVLLGASGFIGQAFAGELQRRGLPFTATSRRELDYTRFEPLLNFLRATKPAFYADKNPLKTLNDKLSASGKFLFTSSQSSAGIWFGWFRARQEIGAARPASGLGLIMDFE